MAIVATTTVVSAQAVGGTPGFVQLTKTSADSTTSAYVVSTKILCGAAVYDPGQRLKLYYTSSPYDISTTANAAALQLKSTARTMDLQLGQQLPGDTIILDSTLEVLTGGYIYIWLDSPTVSPVYTVTITLIELS